MTETVEWNGCLTKIMIEGRDVLLKVVAGVVVAGTGGRMLLDDMVFAGAISNPEKSTTRKEVMGNLEKSISSENDNRGPENDR
jgi:hypothetical protein